ncbi:MAG: aldehyde:ferredoxin oxidoreductase [Anaerolineaceae bacterium]|jgi:aldehyde:ferredoxin oxidoreductase|nr:MAG: aldehyde:ferredoxin oxidoreductase [Anaerolineaceae bacterium]
MPFGYTGKILEVDLSTKSWKIIFPEETLYQMLGGGSALGVYYVLKNTPAHIDALSPQNTLVFSVSVVTGAPISGLSRMNVTAKSPLTGAIGDSQSGGFFPVELKFAGFDGIVVKGCAQSPVYLWINNGQVEIRAAAHLWGKLTAEVETLIREELGDPKIQIAQCGIAGENGVRFASIMTNANRANGRTGMGAVMASKNLKAIAVRGTAKPALANPEKLRQLARSGVQNLKQSGSFGLSLSGTAGAVAWQSRVGGLPTKNYSSGVFDDCQNLDGETINQEILVKRDTCYGCVVRCKPVVHVDSALYPVDEVYGGPEYETLATFGSYCGISNLHAVAYMNQLCNMYGMDTITCGATIAWAMECFEKGKLTSAQLDGLELRFGNHQAAVALVEKIAHRQGIGKILSEGSARAAAIFGNGTQDFLITVKGQELPAHMPQNKASLGLIYAVNPFGADHQSSEHDAAYTQPTERMAALLLDDPQPENVLNAEKARYASITQCLYASMDSLCACQFVYGAGWQLYGPQDLVDVLNAVTGWRITIPDLLDIGKRRIQLMRIFNFREGFTRDNDKLPLKLFQPLIGGATDGVKLMKGDFENALDAYYEQMGLQKESGKPSVETLKALHLNGMDAMLE